MSNSKLDDESYDAVVVGAGHNGLVCAAYLAQAGHRVAIVERRDTVGGACVTEELFPGYRFSTASLATALFRQEIVDDLSLAKHGLEIIPRDLAVTALFPDGRTLALGSDDDLNAAQIARFSTRDAQAYVEYGQTMQRLGKFVEPFLTGASRTPLFDDVPALKAALAAAAELPDQDLRRLTLALFGSARDLLDDFFESDELKVTLSTDGTVGYDGGPSDPGTAYLLLYHQLGSTDSGRPSWGQVKGGMGSITQALAAACREYGGDVITGQPVTRIQVGREGAQAVELGDGRVLRARAIVSAADPRTTFLRLLDADAVPAAYRHVVAGRDYEGVAAKIHLALDHLPSVRGLADPDYRGTMLIAPTMDHLDRIHAEAKRGRPPLEPHVECTFPSVLDPGLAPPGKYVMSMFVQYVPYTLSGTTWDEIRDSFADRTLGFVEGYLPGLGAAVIDRKVFSPYDLERELGLPGGNLYHGAMSPLDVFAGRPVAGFPDYHTPVPGLFLCGSGTRPGGGVFGVPGKNASDVVRRRLET
ncbi:phytoene desaturase family protein [Amycolatopsis sp. cg9]|uniref:phytoene desaturase family protein n=1 Tax=Amycolatopsis sp. cg9 TaxID=3238801 RepID=UPI003524D436